MKIQEFLEGVSVRKSGVFSDGRSWHPETIN